MTRPICMPPARCCSSSSPGSRSSSRTPSTGILEQHLRSSRPDPRAVAPERAIPDELAAICMRAVCLRAGPPIRIRGRVCGRARRRAGLPPTSAPPLGRAGATPSRDCRRAAAGTRTPAASAECSPDSLGSAMGRYSLAAGEDRSSGEHLTSSGNPTFWMLQELERDAAAAMTRRRWAQAIEKLRQGLDAAAELVRSGERELGAAAQSGLRPSLGRGASKGRQGHGGDRRSPKRARARTARRARPRAPPRGARHETLH